MKKPVVTIAIPTFNREEYLKLAIECCLNQTYNNCEILIVDNCSTDGTINLVKSIHDTRVVYYRQKASVSPINNWNKCIELAQSDYFTFLTDDDLISNDYVEIMLRTILEYKDAAIVRCGAIVIDSKGNRIGSRLDLPEIVNINEYVEKNMSNQLIQSLGGLICSTKLIKASGGFEESYLPHTLYADHLLWLKLAINGSIVVTLQKKLFFYRVHSSQLANNINILDFVSNSNLYVNKYKGILNGKNICSDILDYANNKFATSLVNHRLRICIGRILNGNAIYEKSFVFSIFKLYLKPKYFNLKYLSISLILLVNKELCNNLLNVYHYVRKYCVNLCKILIGVTK